MRRENRGDRSREPRAVAMPAGLAPRIAFALVAAGALLWLLSTRAHAEERTIDDIEIEGEVRLPQVLFITSRESERPLDWLEGWAEATAADIALDAWAPARLQVIPTGATPAAAPEEAPAPATDLPVPSVLSDPVPLPERPLPESLEREDPK
ncbi:MAG: hypothetical protein R3B81_07025 [bacterium]